MEQCDVASFFAAISESKVTLESILHCCVLDDRILKGIEGLPHSVMFIVCVDYMTVWPHPDKCNLVSTMYKWYKVSISLVYFCLYF